MINLVRFFEGSIGRKLKNVDLETDHGCFDSRPFNGDFSFSWSPQVIEICVAKYGDGNGGSIILSIPSSPESISELQRVLVNLKKHVEAMEKINSLEKELVDEHEHHHHHHDGDKCCCGHDHDH